MEPGYTRPRICVCPCSQRGHRQGVLPHASVYCSTYLWSFTTMLLLTQHFHWAFSRCLMLCVPTGSRGPLSSLSTAQYIRLSHGLDSVYCPSFTYFSVSSHSRLFSFELRLPCTSSSIHGKADVQTLAWVPSRGTCSRRVQGERAHSEDVKVDSHIRTPT